MLLLALYCTHCTPLPFLHTLHSSQVILWGRKRAERLPCLFWKLFQKHSWTFWLYERKWDCNSRMGFSPHIKIAGVVPRLSGRIPTQDLGEVVMTVPTTGYKDMIVNDNSSMSSSWGWKVASLNLHPIQLAPISSVDSNLSFSCEGFENTNFHRVISQNDFSAGDEAEVVALVTPGDEKNLCIACEYHSSDETNSQLICLCCWKLWQDLKVS